MARKARVLEPVPSTSLPRRMLDMDGPTFYRPLLMDPEQARRLRLVSQEWLCGVPTCPRRHYALGLCELHWQRHRRGADLYAPVQLRRVMPSVKTMKQCFYCGIWSSGGGLIAHEKKCLRDNGETLLSDGRRCTGRNARVSWAMNGSRMPPIPFGWEEHWTVVGERTTLHGERAVLVEAYTAAERDVFDSDGLPVTRRYVIQIAQHQLDAFVGHEPIWRAMTIGMARDLNESRQRALRLLRRHLRPEEDQMLRRLGWLVLVGSRGGAYMITMERQHNIYELNVTEYLKATAGDSDKFVSAIFDNIVAEHCIHVEEHVPLEDNFLAQVLLIEKAEEELHRISNRTPLELGPRAGSTHQREGRAMEKKKLPLYKDVPNEKRWTKFCTYLLIFQLIDTVLEAPIYAWEIVLDALACYAYVSILYGRPRLWWESEKKKEAA